MSPDNLREGNLIRISPRPNEEGVLKITEFHRESIIGEMQYPRIGYLFRIKFHEILPLPITPRWLSAAGFTLENGSWVNGDHTLSAQGVDGTWYFTHDPQHTFSAMHELQNALAG
jgi:hypothetical protein